MQKKRTGDRCITQLMRPVINCLSAQLDRLLDKERHPAVFKCVRWLLYGYYICRINWLPKPTAPDEQMKVDEAQMWIRYLVGLLRQEKYPNTTRIEGTQPGRILYYRLDPTGRDETITYWRHRVICGGWLIGETERQGASTGFITRTPIYLLSDCSIAVGVSITDEGEDVYVTEKDARVNVYRLKKWRRLPGIRYCWGDDPITFQELCDMLQDYVNCAQTPQGSRTLYSVA